MTYMFLSCGNRETGWLFVVGGEPITSADVFVSSDDTALRCEHAGS
jgi:hypothetical protein